VGLTLFLSCRTVSIRHDSCEASAAIDILAERTITTTLSKETQANDDSTRRRKKNHEQKQMVHHCRGRPRRHQRLPLRSLPHPRRTRRQTRALWYCWRHCRPDHHTVRSAHASAVNCSKWHFNSRSNVHAAALANSRHQVHSRSDATAPTVSRRNPERPSHRRSKTNGNTMSGVRHWPGGKVVVRNPIVTLARPPCAARAILFSD